MLFLHLLLLLHERLLHYVLSLHCKPDRVGSLRRHPLLLLLLESLHLRLHLCSWHSSWHSRYRGRSVRDKAVRQRILRGRGTRWIHSGRQRLLLLLRPAHLRGRRTRAIGAVGRATLRLSTPCVRNGSERLLLGLDLVRALLHL